MSWNLKRPLLLLAILCLPVIIGVEISVASHVVIGKVENVQGVAEIIRQDQTISATIGFELWQHDTLRTGRDGSIGVVFTDDSLISLGPNSLLVIDEFSFSPRQEKVSFTVRMLKGTAAYVSGIIAKLSPEAARVETPSASIGIRGTKFLIKVEDSRKWGLL